MKQVQFFKFTSIGLLILNLIIIGLFLFSKPPTPSPTQGQRSGPPHRWAMGILKLDKDQKLLFDEIVKKHSQKMRALNKENGALLEEYFFASEDQSEELLNKIEAVERSKIQATQLHFEQIKAILKPDQDSDFQRFKTEAIKKILIKNDKPSRPPKDF